MPKPVVGPLPPEQIKTTEELYLAGQRIEQFHSASLDPMAYWQEALRRDPGDVRVNTAMGITRLTPGPLRRRRAVLPQGPRSPHR